MTDGALETDDQKRRAVEHWTADPCGAVGVPGVPGTREYFLNLLARRREYAPWMSEELDYAGAAVLDVLDLGCGQGIDLAHYAQAGARATGVDLTPRHVELARAHLEALGLDGVAVVGDAERLPFGDETFDRVSSNGVLHHTPDVAAALHETYRVLRPGGEVRVIVYNRRSFHYWLTQVFWHGVLCGRLFRLRSIEKVMSETVEYTSVGSRPLVRAYTADEVAALLRDAGFELVATRIRHLRAEDTPPTKLLSILPGGRRLLPPAALDRLGRAGGWYVVGVGRKPGQ